MKLKIKDLSSLIMSLKKSLLKLEREKEKSYLIKRSAKIVDKNM